MCRSTGVRLASNGPSAMSDDIDPELLPDFPTGDPVVFWRAFSAVMDTQRGDSETADFTAGMIALAAHLPSDWTVSRMALAAAACSQWADEHDE